MPQLEPSCSAKLFPLQPQDAPTKENFFHSIIFLVTFGVLGLQEDKGGEGNL